MKPQIFQKCIDSPLGWLLLESDAKALLSISFIEEKQTLNADQPEILELTESQLVEYFQGSRTVFELKLTPTGTVFQQKVWEWVSKVEFGKTSTYLEIAKKTGSKNNTRAVGMANGKNPLPIIIPCHRIIGSNQKLTGYAGGIDKKRWLLQHEQKYSTVKTTLF